MKRIVVVPTYNELDNAGPLIERVRELGYDILIVDDPGGDDTAAVVAELAEKDGGVHLIARERREGYGTALREGIAWALAQDFEQIAQMDADFSHDPAVLPVLFRVLDEADLVIGSRYVFGGQTPGWSPWRRRLSRGAGWLARRALRLSISDPTSGFRAWRAELLRRMDLSDLRARQFVTIAEMAWRAGMIGARIREVPITYHDRRAGESKMSPAIALEGLRVIYTLWKEGKRT